MRVFQNLVIRGRVTVIVVALLALVSCSGGGSPTGPSSSSASGGVSSGGSSGQQVFVVFVPIGGSYTAQLAGQTYTAEGGFTVSLPVGSHQVTGSFVGTGFGVSFKSLTLSGGGVQSGSVRGLSGPPAELGSCDILYFNFDQPTVRRSFQLQFQVTADRNSTCQ